jgi:hypothetical protein
VNKGWNHGRQTAYSTLAWSDFSSRAAAVARLLIGHTGGVRTIYRPWITYLLVGLFFASQVPFLIRDAEWLRAGLMTAAAVLLLMLGAIRTRRRLHGRAEHPRR